MLIAVALLLSFGNTAIAEEFDWKYYARRLTGFSDKTQRDSTQKLKNLPGLSEKLHLALRGTDRYLACDVIGDLGLTAFLPELLELSSKDESGIITLTINTLLTSQTRPTILEHYIQRLDLLHREALSVPTLVAMLDVLGRMGHALGESQVDALFESRHPEVRSAVLYYARLLESRQKQWLYPEIYRKALRDTDVQIQEQGRFAFEEKGQPLPPTKKGWLAALWHELTRQTEGRKALEAPAPAHLLFFYRPAKIPDLARAVCDRAYENFFSKKQIDIRIVFGYKDARPARFVGDRYETYWLISYLTAPCREGWGACGFERDKKDSTLFTKVIAGPDGKPRHVRLHLVSSSAGPDDAENRKDPYQKVKSARARELFLEGIESAQVVFYSGHSRDGGGPDFDPPQITEDGHVDYNWYVKNAPGMEPLMGRLKQGSDLKVLGLFSCASTKHFAQSVRKVQPRLALITSPRLLYYTDAMKDLLGAISALLRRECETDFGSALRSSAKVGDAHLTGFFKN